METPDVIILAGGRGSRMQSTMPKPLRIVGRKATIARIVESASALSKKPIIVIGANSKEITGALGKNPYYVTQKEQRGTGHAVMCALSSLPKYHFKKNIIILPGDHPLITRKTLRALYDEHRNVDAVISLCTLRIPNFTGSNKLFHGYGRIRRTSDDRISGIVEVKDASESEKEIREVNVGYYCFKTAWLQKNIHTLDDANAAGEFYITDLIGIAIANKNPVHTHVIKNPAEAMGFNTPEQLEIIRSRYQQLRKTSATIHSTSKLAHK